MYNYWILLHNIYAKCNIVIHKFITLAGEDVVMEIGYSIFKCMLI